MPICVDGPLRNEEHEQGESFTFHGGTIGEENGVYRLIDGEYHWEADNPTERPQSK